MAQEWERNNTDMLSEGEEDTGLTVADVIQMEGSTPDGASSLPASLALNPSSHVALNIFLPVKPARRCSARR